MKTDLTIAAGLAWRKAGLAAAVFIAGFILFFGARAIAPKHGLLGRYYPNDQWAGPPASTCLEPALSFSHDALTAKAGDAGTSSAVWEGFLFAPRDATYRLSVSSDDGSWIFIDDALVVDNGGQHPVKEAGGDIALAKGGHRIRLEYFNGGGSGSFVFKGRRMASPKGLGSRLSLYPRDVGSNLVFFDTVLSVLEAIAIGISLLAGLVLLLAVPRSLAAIWAKMRSLWARGGARWRVFLSAGPKRLVPLAAVCAGLFLMMLGAKSLSPAHGLNARYFANAGWEGPPKMSGVDAEAHVRSKTELAERTGQGGLSSVLWEGTIFAPRDGMYRFSVSSDDGSWVYVDDVLRLDHGRSNAAGFVRKDVYLSRGSHRLLIKYFDSGGAALFDLRWKKGGGLSFLRPRLRAYPRPPSRGTILSDKGLGCAVLLLKVLFAAVGLLFLAVLGPAAGVLNERWPPYERPRPHGSRRVLAAVRKRFVLAAAVCGALLLALIGAERLASAHGLVGRYFDNPAWSGAPASTVRDSVIHFDEDALSRRSAESDAFTVEWDGYIFAPKDSSYRFTLTSSGISRISLDGAVLIETGAVGPERTADKEIPLSRGNHRLLFRYAKSGEGGVLDFRWAETRTPKAIMPPLRFYSRPVTLAAVVADTVISKASGVLWLVLIALGLLLFTVAARAALPRSNPASVLTVLLFLVLAGAYELKVFSRRSTSASGCDSYAYLHGAELMAENGLLRTEFSDPPAAEIYRSYAPTPPEADSIFLLSPHGYYVSDLGRGLVYNVFPPGMSLLLYLPVKAAGREAAFFLLPCLNLAFLVLLFYGGAKRAGPAFGMVLAASTMFNPVVFSNSVEIMSDVPSMILLAAGAFFLLLNIGNDRRWAVFLAGACFGFSLVVRYSNLMGALPLGYLLCLGWRGKRRKAFGDLALFCAGAFLFGILPLAIYTHRLFGTVFRLVYEPLTQSRMSWANFAIGVPFYGRSTVSAFGLPGAVLILVGLGSAIARPTLRRVGVTCLLAYTAFFGFYAFQSIQQDRYLLPAYPFLGVLYGLGVLAVVRRLDRLPGLAFLIVALCAAYPFFQAKGQYPYGNVREEAVCRAVKSKLDPGAVLFCDQLSGTIRLYAGVPGYRFTWTRPETLRQTLSILNGLGRPVYFYPDEKTALDRFRTLVGDGVIPEAELALVGRIRGLPLYRYGPKKGGSPPAVNPSGNGAAGAKSGP